MSANFIEMILKLLTSGATLSKLASMLGIDEGKTKAILGAALPAILAAFAKKASTRDGASRLAATVDEADEGILDNLGSLLGGGSDLVDKGSGMLGSLFGNSMLSGLNGALAKFSGVDSSTIGKAVGGLAPVVLGFLKKEKQAAGLDAGGLASLLEGQKDAIAGAMPKGLGDLLGSVEGLGVGDLARSAGRAAEAVGSSAGQAAEAAAAGGSSMFKRLLPLLLIAAAAFFLFKMLGNRGGDAGDAGAGGGVPGAVSGAADVIADVKNVVSTTTAALADVSDLAGAQAALPKLQEAAGKLEELAPVWEALPDSAKATVSAAVKPLVSQLRELLDPLLAMPQVGPVIRPVAEKMLSHLESMGGA